MRCPRCGAQYAAPIDPYCGECAQRGLTCELAPLAREIRVVDSEANDTTYSLKVSGRKGPLPAAK